MNNRLPSSSSSELSSLRLKVSTVLILDDIIDLLSLDLFGNTTGGFSIVLKRKLSSRAD